MVATIFPVIVGIVGGVAVIVIFATLYYSSNEKEWFHFVPIQCTIYPWEVGADKPYFKMSFEEQAARIKNYFDRQEIHLFDIKYPDDYFVVCEGCNCGRGYFMDFLVSKSDIAKIEETIAKPSKGIQQSNFIITNATFQNAIALAESLNETKVFKKTFEKFGISHEPIKPQATYLTSNQTQSFWRYHSESFLPNDKPAILVAYVIKLDVENSAGLGVFIEPNTNHVYGTYRYQTQFG